MRVGTVITFCWGCWSQNRLMIYCIEQIYCAFTTNSPEVIICPSTVVLFFNVYASDVKMITQNPFVDVSAVLMAPYIPDSTNEAILSHIPSITTWCISSNEPKGVDLCDNRMMFQLLNEPRTGQFFHL